MENGDWKQDVLEIKNHYQKKIKKKKEISPASLDWRDRKTSNFVFLTALNGLKGKFNSVFDVGCGTGDLFIYLRNNNYGIDRYCGVDIVPEFINYGIKINKITNLINGNFLELKNNQKYDLVTNLGGLCSITSSYKEYLLRTIIKMIEISNKYVVFNLIINVDKKFFSTSNRKIGHIANVSIEDLMEILSWIKKLYPKLRYKISQVTVFKGSRDAFVRIEL